MRSILKKISAVALGTGLSQILNFVFGIILVRVLTVQEFAVYKQGIIFIATTIPFIYILSPVALGYFIGKAKTNEQKSAYIFQSIFIVSAIGFLFSSIMVFFRSEISEFYANPLLEKYIFYFAIIQISDLVAGIYTYSMIAINRSKQFAIVTVVFSLFRILGLLVAMGDKENILNIFLISYTAIVVVRAFYMFFDLYRFCKPNIKFGTFEALKSQILFSIPLYFTTIINTLNDYADKNIVALLYSPTDYALYVNGAYQIPLVSVISTSIISVMLPEIASKYEKGNLDLLNKIVSSYKKVVSIASILIIPLIVCLIVFAKGVVLLLFGEKYLDSTTNFKIYQITMISKIFNWGVLLTAANRQSDVVKSGSLMLFTNLVFLLIANKLFGLQYLALAPVLATFVMVVIMYVYVKRAYRQSSMMNLVPIFDIIILLGISFGIAIVTKFLTGQYESVSIAGTVIGLVVSYSIILICGLCIKFGISKVKGSVKNAFRRTTQNITD